MQLGYNQLGVTCSQFGQACLIVTDWKPYPASIAYQPCTGCAAFSPAAPEMGITEPTGRGNALPDLKQPTAIWEREAARAAYEQGAGFAVCDLQRATSVQEVIKGKAEKEPTTGEAKSEPRHARAEADGSKAKTEES